VSVVVAATAFDTASAAVSVPAADEAAIFQAAGFKLSGDQWRSDCDDPGTPSYSPGAIETLGDLNGDGLPEAVVTEGGTYCYGNIGVDYSLVTKGGSGKWNLVTAGLASCNFLKRREPTAGRISRSADPAFASLWSGGTARNMRWGAISTR
jgi:hypothetical protein